MGDDLRAPGARRVAHTPAAGSASGRLSASGQRMASPARPARGRDPSVRSPLSPFVTPRPHSHPPSQQTQQPGRRRDGPQASSSTGGVRRELSDSGSDEENEGAADAPSLQPRPKAKKAKQAKLPTAKQVAMDFVRAFLEGTSPADKRARFFTRPPGPAEKGTTFEAADRRAARAPPQQRRLPGVEAPGVAFAPVACPPPLARAPPLPSFPTRGRAPDRVCVYAHRGGGTCTSCSTTSCSACTSRSALARYSCRP